MEFQGNDIDTVERLLGSITAQTSPELTAAIIDSLRASSAEETAGALLDAFPGFTPTGKASAIRTLLARPDFTRELLAAIDEGTVSVNDLALDQKQALLTHPDDDVREIATELLARSGSVPNADRQAVIEEYASVCDETGDVMLGKAIFTKHCAICHTHSGEGKQIGPDLTGMAVHPKHELLIHILDPSRSVEGNFRLYTIATVDGQIVSGMLASETRTTLELYDSLGKTIVVLREDIEELISTNKSLMPEGVEKNITREELVHLLEFLTAKGKYVPLPLGQVATAISTRGMFQPDDEGPDRLIFEDWSVKTFGDVPFLLVDPREGTVPNVVLLHGPRGHLPPSMPESVELPCNTSAVAIHMLSGISGWGFPFEQEESVTMIVRLHYADGTTEDHELINGRHFADYIRRVDVPESEFAFEVRDQQIRYLSVIPERSDVIERIELIKGDDATAPIVVAITVQTVE
jgi:putative heme-binding domain-containing protein